MYGSQINDTIPYKSYTSQQSCCSQVQSFVVNNIHAISGCDTTSILFVIGRSNVIKTATNDKSFFNHAHTFCTIQNRVTFQTANESASVCLYGGRHCDTLNSLRKTTFKWKVAKNITFFDVHIFQQQWMQLNMLNIILFRCTARFKCGWEGVLI